MKRFLVILGIAVAVLALALVLKKVSIVDQTQDKPAASANAPFSRGPSAPPSIGTPPGPPPR